MERIESELKELKSTLLEEWNLVISQLRKSYEAMEKHDKDLAKEIIANEKLVDAYELKIDMDCENILALFNPLATDLRFVLAVLKINYNLERIGDYCNAFAKVVWDSDKNYNEEHFKKAGIFEMFEIAIGMQILALESFENENAQIPRKVFKNDDDLDKINKNANDIIAKLIRKNPTEIHNCLNLLTTIRRLERVGDQTKSIAEEIIFYLEAKVLKHKKKKEKLEKGFTKE
jgi:phosphate transport system protein